ncbi:hypothetical protein E4U41_003622 [Claviceps citrina]|nr:hypothetical protein E4U41_003622 [Claviceps citrina]
MQDSSTRPPPTAPAAASAAASAAPPPPTHNVPPPALTPLQRQAKQLGLLLAGAGFMAASVAVARRSVLRRQLESLPKFYSGNRTVPRIDPAERSLLAVQALGLATLNVASFAILLTGGIAWAFDLCDVRELRSRTRASLRRPGVFSDEEEKEMEKMMGSILDRLGMQQPPPGGEGAHRSGGQGTAQEMGTTDMGWEREKTK